jgi:hypothetical protein
LLDILLFFNAIVIECLYIMDGTYQLSRYFAFLLNIFPSLLVSFK